MTKIKFEKSETADVKAIINAIVQPLLKKQFGLECEVSSVVVDPQTKMVRGSFFMEDVEKDKSGNVIDHIIVI